MNHIIAEYIDVHTNQTCQRVTKPIRKKMVRDNPNMQMNLQYMLERPLKFMEIMHNKFMDCIRKVGIKIKSPPLHFRICNDVHYDDDDDCFVLLP